ncbi:MAG: hypothetical protein OJF52_003727 [Nitrospira sp.]|jgi:hypothetical protein|nr:MAG: hypothetical protein OJF52_003727 [Nitrospira sp.]
MKAQPAIWFYPSDWLRDPALRSCSLEARGLWIDLLCFMHEGCPYGHFQFGNPIPSEQLHKVIARMTGIDLRAVRRLINELRAAEVFSLNEDGVMYSRRLTRDHDIRTKRAQGGVLSLQNPNVPRRKRDLHESQEGYPSAHPSPPSFDTSLGVSLSSSYSISSSEEEKIAGSTPSSPAAASSGKRRMQLTDAEFLNTLRLNPAYKHLDLDAELGKMDAWLATPRGKGKQKTRQRVVNWLNRAVDDHRPMDSASPSAAPHLCTEKVHGADGRRYQICGKPIALNQQPQSLPYCSEHLRGRQLVAAHLANGHAS